MARVFDAAKLNEESESMLVHRIEIQKRADQIDPRADDLKRNAAAFLGLQLGRVRTSDVYLVEGDLTTAELAVLAENLLADPVTQEYRIGRNGESGRDDSTVESHRRMQIVEVHPLPGVMDPVAQSVEACVKALLSREALVRTGIRYEIEGLSGDQTQHVSSQLLANPIVQEVHFETYCPDSFPHGHKYTINVTEIPIRDLDDPALEKMSRQSHLFLSLDEMCAIREYYRGLSREPRDVELETLAQTWSEHCVHKTLKSTIRFEGEIPDAASRPGHEVHDDGTVTIHNLLKSTVAAATHELMNDGVVWCLSVFVDNAGVVRFDDDTAVCFKVETHNHPSALEPYGGAATGIGGCIRDIIGTGLAARPIASTDIFCVGYPNLEEVPTGCLHPRRILTQVVAGVRDYGNRMGIPTINGAVYFDNRYVGNPLVYCGCIGEMPIEMVKGEAKAGDHIIVLGGRTGRDGIHGATFSSAELSDTHADEFSHAVQIGNAITEKKVLDAILRMRDHEHGCLFNAITDCGAGGFSSAVGEMGEHLGAEVHLERAPLKYQGLSYTEIWISEAQERMVLAVPEANFEKVRSICAIEDVEWCDLGTFGTPDRELILHYAGTEVGRLSMEFLHNGLPMPTREARFRPSPSTTGVPPVRSRSDRSGLANGRDNQITDLLHSLLSHPNIASKHWIVRQYDHEVQGRAVVRPFAGEARVGPSDASVILPKRHSTRGLAIANGLATGFAADPYQMTLAAVDECVRNLVCVGTDPSRIAILDNFCWPSCTKPENLGSLVLAAEGCYDAAKAYCTPFISGKDSLNNQFTTDTGDTIEIPPTLLISGFGIVRDVTRCITMDAKAPSNVLIIVGETDAALGGSHVLSMLDVNSPEPIPATNLALGPRMAKTVAQLINNGLVRSAHDCSDGGLLVAAAEMAFGGMIGLDLDLSNLPARQNDAELDLLTKCFAETPGRYLLEVRPDDLAKIEHALGDLPWAIIGEFNDSIRLTLREGELDASLDALQSTWRTPLDW